VDKDIHRYIHGYYAGAPADLTEYLYAWSLSNICLSAVLTLYFVIFKAIESNE